MVRVNNRDIYTLYEYDGFAKDVLLRYKERHDRILNRLFLCYYRYYLNIRYWNYEICLAPSHMDTLRERSFHAVHEMFCETRLSINDRFFIKSKAIRQSEQPKFLRKNIAHYIKIDTKYTPKRKHVLVVDDVVTTGETLSVMARKLEELGYKVRLFAVYRHKMLETHDKPPYNSSIKTER